MKTFITLILVAFVSVSNAENNQYEAEGVIRQAECSEKNGKGIFELLVKNGNEIKSIWLKTDTPALYMKTVSSNLFFGSVCQLTAIAATNTTEAKLVVNKVHVVDGMVREIDYSQSTTIETADFFSRKSKISYEKDQAHDWYFSVEF